MCVCVCACRCRCRCVWFPNCQRGILGTVFSLTLWTHHLTYSPFSYQPSKHPFNYRYFSLLKHDRLIQLAARTRSHTFPVRIVLINICTMFKKNKNPKKLFTLRKALICLYLRVATWAGRSSDHIQMNPSPGAYPPSQPALRHRLNEVYPGVDDRVLSLAFIIHLCGMIQSLSGQEVKSWTGGTKAPSFRLLSFQEISIYLPFSKYSFRWPLSYPL